MHHSTLQSYKHLIIHWHLAVMLQWQHNQSRQKQRPETFFSFFILSFMAKVVEIEIFHVLPRHKNIS
jgi:hypothetical protein